MKPKDVTAEYRLSQWARIIQERGSTGESINKFCQNRGIKRHSYFYWQRKLREAACEQFALPQEVARFTEVKLSVPEISNPETTDFGQLRIEVGVVQITADSRYPT